MGDRACMCLTRGDEVLLVRQSYQGRMLWTFPGGGIEAGETPAEAATREVKEETALDAIVWVAEDLLSITREEWVQAENITQSGGSPE